MLGILVMGSGVSGGEGRIRGVASSCLGPLAYLLHVIRRSRAGHARTEGALPIRLNTPGLLTFAGVTNGMIPAPSRLN